jgi:sugar phosphate isomerase/epimerase
MFSFGLKLWSTNENYIEEVIRLKKNGDFDYIELFIVPDTQDRQIKLWLGLQKQYGINYVLHAPHFMAGLNLSKRESLKKNIELAKITLTAADRLGSEIVIFHPGIGGQDEEVVFQLKKIFDPRIVIENKPYYPLNNINGICNGYSPASIKYIMDNTRVGFCLDIGHAICAANAVKANRYEYIKRFIALKPKIFHLTDGENNGLEDKHLHFGKGDYEIERILTFLPADSSITIETEKDHADTLADYEKDVERLKMFASVGRNK